MVMTMTMTMMMMMMVHLGKRSIEGYACSEESNCTAFVCGHLPMGEKHLFVAWNSHSLEDKGSSLMKLGGYVLRKH